MKVLPQPDFPIMESAVSAAGWMRNLCLSFRNGVHLHHR